jgi:FkbM family methyltransferase
MKQELMTVKSTQVWKPYSNRAALIRRFIPDIRMSRDIGDGLKIYASPRKHLHIFRPSRLRNDVQIASKLSNLVPRDGVIFDLGANIGLYSLVFASNRARRVHAFEPFDKALAYLHDNLRLNQLRNVEVHPIVLTDWRGVCRFSVDTVTQSTSHISAEDEPGIDLACSDLDSYMSNMNLPLPDLIKMDVEGADEAILRGMQRLLRQRRTYVFLEGGLRDDSGRITAIDYLMGFDYSIWDLGLTRRLDSSTPEYMFVAVPHE